MGKHWKILGLSLLALIGVLAVNASAAQAEWLLLVNKLSVEKIKVVGTSEGGFLLAESGSKLHCTGSEGFADAEMKETKKLLGGTATITFKGCTDEAFKTCTVNSPGQAGGTIVATGKGDVEMGASAEEVWITATSANFTQVNYTGEKCPLNEAEEVVSGSAKVVILNALQDLKLHEIHIEGIGLKLGNSKATLHMLNGEGKQLPLILGSITEATGGTFALHLCNLGGPACKLIP